MVLTYLRSRLQILRWQLINQQWRKLPSLLLLTKRARARAKSLPLLTPLHLPRMCLLLLQWYRERLLPPLPAKTATVKPTSTKVATKPQAPKQTPKSFAQAARSGNPQSTPRFAPASAHPEYESLLCLHDIFPDLPMEKVLAMHQSGFSASASPNRGGTVHSGTSRAPKMTTHGPTRC